MKLGLITDIHEHVENLTSALDLFGRERVDQIVFIGDLFEVGQRIAESCRLLRAAGVIGVWGNHDFGLCLDPSPDIRRRYPADVLDTMASFRPRLEIEGCLFAHIEPWLDPEKIEDLWYFDGPPDEPAKLDRIFNAVPNRLMFGGHYHRWLAVTPERILPWEGETPIWLNDGRYFVVIGAVCEGRCALFDTETSELRPIYLSGEGSVAGR